MGGQVSRTGGRGTGGWNSGGWGTGGQGGQAKGQVRRETEY